ncbi:metabolite traffic protein EboE [Microbacterium halophytorum]|uniref:metabolite traffic protein EboE n=1 Tax=Microbacterium halophytorum TaxID=2067568 RepID=UPI000CFAF239|nr:metabolite traffic protein EboE [Microbacterium halophytorum]
MRLSYCTNAHPAEDVDGIIAQLHEHAGPARRASGLGRLGVGLWLPVDAAAQLAEDADARARLAAALDAEGLELFTVNAFPYRGFHDDVVKLGVYSPDWTSDERLEFTKDCATALALLLPEGESGSISTLPLGWRDGWTPERDAAAASRLRSLHDHLAAIERETGRSVRIAVEPEPGCILDDVDDVVDWLAAHPELTADGRIGVCLDTCHLAVSYADPAAAVRRIEEAGVRVVKVQASAALEVPDPSAAAEALAPFAEARYLHQVRTDPAAGEALRADDLVDVLADHEWPHDRPWRVHVHIPLHLTPAAPLASTQHVLREAVAAVLETEHGAEAHLDIETYTWTVLPAEMQPATLADGIAGEVRWAARELPVDMPVASGEGAR